MQCTSRHGGYVSPKAGSITLQLVEYLDTFTYKKIKFGNSVKGFLSIWPFLG
jgi:hypothetical protein